MRNLSDIEIIEVFNKRKNEAVKEFYERYSHLVYGVCLKYLNSREDSMDAVIEIFELLLDKIPEYTITNFRSWLYSVTKNHCLMKLRKIKRQQEMLASHFFEEQEVYNPENTDYELLSYEKIETAMAQLSDEQKICMELFYYHRRSYTEISEETGFSVKLVKSYMQNGRIKLKKIIDEQL